MIDRSDSVEFSKKPYRDGMRARRKGRTLHSNPWLGGTLAFRSWSAGWADQDQNEAADQSGSEKTS